MFDTPILYLIFNRPDHTRRTFEVLRDLRPSTLFIACDGPRSSSIEDVELVIECQAIVNAIDWPCEVQTLFREHNLGCGKAVSGAIDWFFSHVESGIILEDDVLPDPSFFTFCRQMLLDHVADERVMHISGSYFLENYLPQDQYSYYCSRHVHVWGWATWRRAWVFYEAEMGSYSRSGADRPYRRYYGRYFRFWRNIFDQMIQGTIDTWDYQWMYAIAVRNGLAINPTSNLTLNIGFDERATHTKRLDDRYTRIGLSQLTNILPPPRMFQSERKDHLYYKYFLDQDIRPVKRMICYLRTFAGKLKRHYRPF